MTQYAGNDANFAMQKIDGRYFYGLRRTEQGELFFTKVDQLDPNEVVQINKPGDPEKNFNEFESAEDVVRSGD